MAVKGGNFTIKGAVEPLFLRKTKKELEQLDRKSMIEYLIKYAETELNRGSKFLEDR